MISNRIPTTTIGEILREEFLIPMNISISTIAKALDIPITEMEAIIDNKLRITPKLSRKLGNYFSVSAQYFLNMQKEIDHRRES